MKIETYDQCIEAMRALHDFLMSRADRMDAAESKRVGNATVHVFERVRGKRGNEMWDAFYEAKAATGGNVMYKDFPGFIQHWLMENLPDDHATPASR